jgi:hypothetical protein
MKTKIEYLRPGGAPHLTETEKKLAAFFLEFFSPRQPGEPEPSIDLPATVQQIEKEHEAP